MGKPVDANSLLIIDIYTTCKTNFLVVVICDVNRKYYASLSLFVMIFISLSKQLLHISSGAQEKEKKNILKFCLKYC